MRSSVQVRCQVVSCQLCNVLTQLLQMSFEAIFSNPVLTFLNNIHNASNYSHKLLGL